VYHEAAMKKSRVLFGLGKFEEGEKIFPMKRDPEDHSLPVSMKFLLIASSEAQMQQLADLRGLWVSRRRRRLPTCVKGFG
jgi:hypothetical protein